MDHEQELRVLKGQVYSLREEVRQLGELIDTINSPLHKRIWWVLKGYRFRRVGRWYGKTKDLR